jgi:hypothetical protein
MADETTTTTTDAPVTEATDTVPAAVTPPTPDGASTDASTAVASADGPVTVQVTSGTATAQVQGPKASPQQQVPVHETHVKADRVITDTSDPLAVQVPPHGQGDAITPIGAAYLNPQSPEDVFAAAETE